MLNIVSIEKGSYSHTKIRRPDIALNERRACYRTPETCQPPAEEDKLILKYIRDHEKKVVAFLNKLDDEAKVYSMKIERASLPITDEDCLKLLCKYNKP